MMHQWSDDRLAPWLRK